MKAAILFAALAGAAAIAAPPAAAAQEAQRDWSRAVAITPEGGYRMGNPDAPVKVVEFVSLTCGHCAHFSAEAMTPLVERYVRTGRVSFELRNFYLNAIDLVAAVTSRCAAPEDYFAISGEVLRQQEQWVARIRGFGEAERQEIGTLSPSDAMKRIADRAGLQAIAARHDVTPAELSACFADQGRMKRLVEMRQAAEREFGVNSTPSFVVNGKLVPGVHDWATLEPLLRPASGGD